MSSKINGYVSGIDYTYGYYFELNPQRVSFAFLNAGLVPPSIGAACELGFGQGMSTNLHAAASVVRWSGTNFNPSQASFAQEMARVCGSGAELFDEAFEEFCHRADLPDFDYIGLHGIWSWVSDENRRVIVDFIRRKLKVGGVLYISYNTQPGWAAMEPLRDLLMQHVKAFGNDGVGIVTRVESALTFAEQLFSTNPHYANANPQIAGHLKQIKEQDRGYLAHEYFNDEWQPMSFAKMAKLLSPAKLQWACSANFVDAIDMLNLTPDQQNFLAEIPDRMFRQTTRDFCVNQFFRKDYWVKGARQLTKLEQMERLRIQRIVMVRAREHVNLKVIGHAGEAVLQESVYGPILEILSDHTPKTLAHLEQKLVEKDLNFGQILEAIVVLTGMGVVMPAQEEAIIAQVKPTTDRINSYLMSKGRSHYDLKFLACPVTGGGIPVSRFDQLFLRAKQQGHSAPKDWAKFVWNLLKQQGHRIVKDGKTLDTDKENLAQLSSEAESFASIRLPILKALQIA